jgi:putative tricarboxylic transport membrane protein
MWIGNLLLVVLNLPLVGIWVKILTIPYRYIVPAVMGCSAASASTVSRTTRRTSS